MTSKVESWPALIQRVVGPFTLIEALMAIAMIFAAIIAPNLGRRTGNAVYRFLLTISARPIWSFAAVFVLAVLPRATFLPWLGAPPPISHDEESLFLQAKTFLLGHLANPVPTFWEHFEGIHFDVVPAYASMYFPGRSLPLLLGMIIADQAWIGVWVSFVMMALASYWMLSRYVASPFALLGSALIVLRLGVFSYWINSYWGGAFTAFGAMLILGALPRFLATRDWQNAALLALGATILLVTRPVEGAMLCVPVAAFLLVRLWRNPKIGFGRSIVRLSLPAMLLLGLGGGWLLAYNQATTGDAFTTPYELNRETYAITPAFLTSPRPHSAQRGPPHFREFYRWEDIYYARRTNAAAMIRGAISKVYYNWMFFVGLILTPAFLAGMWASRRQPFLLGTLGFFFSVYLLETWNFPHYAAPVFPVVIIITMLGFQRLKRWHPAGKEVGPALVRFMPIGVALSLVPPALAVIARSPAFANERTTLLPCCAIKRTTPRHEIADLLRHDPGRDIVLVSTDPLRHPVHTPMVFNEPDLHRADIIWAHLLGPSKDEPMLAYYMGRKVWEVHWRTDGSYILTQRRR